MGREITLRDWQNKFVVGEFEGKDIDTQVRAGWYDWFCKDKSLANKTIKMGNIIKRITDSAKINCDKMYVFFKNSCPMVGNLYDQFKFCDIENRDVIYCINIDSPYDKRDYQAKYTVFGKENDFKTPLFTCQKSNELIRWFNEAI